MMSTRDFADIRRQIHLARYGCEVDITDSLDREEVRHEDGHPVRFPYQIARWKRGDLRHAVLLRPVLKLRSIPGGMFFRDRERWEMDDEAMASQLRDLIATTASAGE